MRDDLRIRALRLRDFRNYGDFDLDGIGNLTVLVGPNGAGKTNVLEAVALLTACSSFRNPQTYELVRQGAREGRASARLEGAGRALDVELSLSAGKRGYSLNGKPRAASALRGMLPAVVFTPDDLEIAKGPSSVRRRAVDALGAQLTGNYHVIMRDYEKVLRYKGRLLRDDAGPLMVRSINDTLVTCAAQLTSYRWTLFSRLAPRMAESYRSISAGSEALSATYEPSWAHAEASGADAQQGPCAPARARDLLSRALDEAFDEERARKRCIVGPHADKIALFLDGRNMADFASQGQQRSAVLAWKVAEVQTIEDSLSQLPVLLLDDVMSELDAARRRALVDLVRRDMQTFVTATSTDGFDDAMLEGARIVEVPTVKEAVACPR